MNLPIRIKDNSCYVLSPEERVIHGENLQKLSSKTIDSLEIEGYPNLLIFPQDFHTYGDNIGQQHIFSYDEEQLTCGNIMGFIGYRSSQINICSRFTKHNGHDYFLHYMLQRVFAINLFNLKCNSNTEGVFDFLIYLFPSFLKRAMRQGLYKEYQTRHYNDANVRGGINVSQHIRQNIPFGGRVAYTTREYATDNHITQLIRHTIEYILKHPYYSNILNNDEETHEAVNSVCLATTTYSKNERRQIINQNIRPVRHPYYGEYRNLQRLCLQILRHEELKYGNDDDQIYGILFDGAWLWEEYLYTILKAIDFKHPENKLQNGGFPMFVKENEEENISSNSRKLYPDFYKEDFILDAKYKHLNSGVGREDLYQIVSYMYCKCAKHGGFLFPNEGNAVGCKHQLNGYNGYIHLFPITIPKETQNYGEFVKQIHIIEQHLINDVVNP